jgi:protein involved in polysaccharide export with SLBB domain
VLIFNTTDFEDRKEVFVYGAVKAPGAFRYGEGLTVNDILALASGFSTDAYRGFVDINRKVRDRNQISQIERLEIDSALSLGSSGELKLKPGDVVVVRPNPELQTIRTVTLEGEWLYPGVYGMQNRQDRLSNIIGRAGGPTPQSDINGFYIIRTNQNPYSIHQSMQSAIVGDSAVVMRSFNPVIDSIALNFKGKNTRSWNFALQDGDRIIAQEKRSEVRINGAVQNPTIVVHVPGRSARYYVRAGGGALRDGRVRRTYVTLPNGMSRKVRNYGVYVRYPRVPAGSTVTVPLELNKEDQDQKVDPAQVAMVSSVLGFLSTTLIGALSLLR